MDFLGFLVFPFSALVAFITLVGAAVSGRQRPRLIWPFAISSLMAVPAIFSLPAAEDIGFWLFAASAVVLWSAAIGTVVGASLARAAIAAFRWIVRYRS